MTGDGMCAENEVLSLTFFVPAGWYWSGGAFQPAPRLANPQWSQTGPGMVDVMVHSYDLSAFLATSREMVPFLLFLVDSSV